MSILSRLFIVATAIALFGTKVQAESMKQERTLVWSDEFDGPCLDLNKWNYDLWSPGTVNQERQQYTKEWQNIRLENGHLKITAKKEYRPSGDVYTSARINTQYKASARYGRIEAAIRMPGGRGAWPSMFMLPTYDVYGSWPRSGEIDIIEYLGYMPNRAHGTIHTQLKNHTQDNQQNSVLYVESMEDEMHVYAIDWSPGEISFSVDNRVYFTAYNDGQGPGTWPFDQDFFVVLNVAVGGTWGGQYGVDDAVFWRGATMEVDYVRFYR